MSTLDAEREMPMAPPGLSNFRDWGGYRLANGGTMARGRLFRSAAPGAVSTRSADVLSRHGIGSVVDLRGTAERGGLNALSALGLTVTHATVEPKMSPPLHDVIAAVTATREAVRDVMIDVYRAFAGPAAEQFGAAFMAIAEAPGPVLVHCTAGKDRTGFLVAVLQRALGVNEDDIRAEFLATNAQWDRASVAGRFTVDPVLVEPIVTADIADLDAAFVQIAQRDGSVHAFIARATGNRFLPSHYRRFIDQGSTP